MNEQNKISEEKIISLYIEDLLNGELDQNNVFKFCSNHKLAEEDFYKYFASLKMIEVEIYAQMAIKSIDLISEQTDYDNYDSKQKMLSFYFTFFEMLNLNRSFVLLSLTDKLYSRENLLKLKKLKFIFRKFVNTLDLSLFNLENTKVNKFQSLSITESAWAQLLYTMKFWIDDQSRAFEKTDIFIEKSINATFDIINSPPRDSLMDLAKFIYKEKFKSSS